MTVPFQNDPWPPPPPMSVNFPPSIQNAGSICATTGGWWAVYNLSDGERWWGKVALWKDDGYNIEGYIIVPGRTQLVSASYLAAELKAEFDGYTIDGSMRPMPFPDQEDSL